MPVIFIHGRRARPGAAPGVKRTFTDRPRFADGSDAGCGRRSAAEEEAVGRPMPGDQPARQMFAGMWTGVMFMA